MEKSTRLFKISIVTSFIFIFCGCDEILECVFNINPQINQKQLVVGVVGERYRDRITAQINNEVNDNDYDYFFDVIGELPPGIFVEFNRRSVEIFGTPEESGVYRFQVELFVERFDFNGFDGSPTCSESDIREFTLQVID
ncbi:hypothetical protein ACOKFD_04325 [Flagellimonas sp. S174]|uniref:hypothetical protein n=1 Tax=Flagellimonas sp. S174 TaxID=3410790 RepID=UPI003BF504BC